MSMTTRSTVYPPAWAASSRAFSMIASICWSLRPAFRSACRVAVVSSDSKNRAFLLQPLELLVVVQVDDGCLRTAKGLDNVRRPILAYGLQHVGETLSQVSGPDSPLHNPPP